jgi:branched-chain amino acid transport system ATP-binding protein
MVTSPLLDASHVSLAFDGIRALDDVSFQVARGEVCALIGPNGAGKSSMLNVISGLYFSDAGEVRFEGARLGGAGDLSRRGIARTFQNIALFRGMTVLENVALGVDFRGRATFLEQAVRIGREVVGRLPYGLQKRVELARALVPRPKLLLLDEPMAGMTVDEKRDMCRYLIDAHEKLGTTLVLIEHDLGVVMDMADHVVVLDYGRKIADGSPDAVRSDPAVVDAYVGSFGT